MSTSELQINPKISSLTSKNSSSKEDEEEKDLEEELLYSKIERINDFQISPTYFFRISLLGDSNVGKTSLITRFCDSTFRDNYSNTIGIDFRVVTLKFENIIVKVHIWDTAGQEKFKSLSSNYFRNSHGFIFVYDIVDRKSFESVDDWVNTAFNYNKENCVISYLVGNKSDRKSEKGVSKEEGEKYAKSKGFFFMETSAKNAENVEKIFTRMTYNIIKYFQENKDKYIDDSEKNYLKCDTKAEELKTVRTGNKKCSC